VKDSAACHVPCILPLFAQSQPRGHTLVGERRYVFGPDEMRPIDFARQALHAGRLTVKHPVTGRALTFEAPLPQDLKELIATLRAARFIERP